MLRWCDCLADDQLTAAARAWQREGAWRLIGIVGVGAIDVLMVWCFGPEQLSDLCDIGRTVAISEEPVVADAVLAFWQNVDQEPSDEL